MKTKNLGFTLIELLVVIAIVGLLSSVVLANMNTSRQKSRDVKRVADVKSLQLALALYFDANAKYPGSLSSGSIELAPTFISSIPTPPGGVSGVTAYNYAPLGSGCNSYHLGTALELSTNTVLTDDSDSSGGVVTPTGDCGSPVSGSEFNGTSVTCNTVGGSTQPGGTEQCFDVNP